MAEPKTIVAAKAGRRVWLSIGAPILGLVLLVSLFAVVLLIDFARQQDDAFAEGSQRLVANGIEAKADALATLTADYAVWDDAYTHVTRRFSRAWLDRNFYSSFVDAFLVLRRGEAPRYVWRGPHAPANFDQVQNHLLNAIEAMPMFRPPLRAHAIEGVARTLLLIDGKLVFVSVAQIASDSQDVAHAGAPDYLVAVQVLDADGKRDAMVRVAEGQKQAAVLEAEGAKQAEVLRAEGHAGSGLVGGAHREPPAASARLEASREPHALQRPISPR